MRLLLDKAVDMSEDGGHSAAHSVVRYFGRIGKMRFILDLDCGYPPEEYKRIHEDDFINTKPKDNWKAEEQWDWKVASKLFLNKDARATSIDIYDESGADEFDEEHDGWMAEYKYSYPAFAFEHIKPDALFWAGIKKVKKQFIRAIFRSL